MEKKKKPRKETQVIEIHIYVHQIPNYSYTPVPNIPPSNTYDPWWNNPNVNYC